MVHNHFDKAAVLWEAFKDRIGQPEFTSITFNLSFFLESNSDLSWLDEPFTKDEIDVVVRNLPNDKAPGPDGFNINFIKSCWHFIKDDFYALCTDFQENLVCLQSKNDSFITLIPKIDGA